MQTLRPKSSSHLSQHPPELLSAPPQPQKSPLPHWPHPCQPPIPFTGTPPLQRPPQTPCPLQRAPQTPSQGSHPFQRPPPSLGPPSQTLLPYPPHTRTSPHRPPDRDPSPPHRDLPPQRPPNPSQQGPLPFQISPSPRHRDLSSPKPPPDPQESQPPNPSFHHRNPSPQSPHHKAL